MDNIFGEVPAYTTIGYWAQELGLSVYKESCTLFKGKRYALVVDESMMIGSEKMLLTLAVAADNIGMAITEKDISIVGKRVRDATLLSIFQFFTFAARI